MSYEKNLDNENTFRYWAEPSLLTLANFYTVLTNIDSYSSPKNNLDTLVNDSLSNSQVLLSKNKFDPKSPYMWSIHNYFPEHIDEIELDPLKNLYDRFDFNSYKEVIDRSISNSLVSLINQIRNEEEHSFLPSKEQIIRNSWNSKDSKLAKTIQEISLNNKKIFFLSPQHPHQINVELSSRLD